MQTYIDRDNNSNISGYEYSDNSFGGSWIEVYFKDDSIYKYTEGSAGARVVQEMIQLARYGDGLNSYISKNNPPYQFKR